MSRTHRIYSPTYSPLLLTGILTAYTHRNKGGHTHRHTRRIYSPTSYIALHERQDRYCHILVYTLNDTLTSKRTDCPTSLTLNTHYNILVIVPSGSTCLAPPPHTYDVTSPTRGGLLRHSKATIPRNFKTHREHHFPSIVVWGGDHQGHAPCYHAS